MRLICPNCGAQYEVGEAMIPDEGREVQCSACGQTWFSEKDVAVKGDPDADPQPEPPRRELDEQTRSILREEAAREAAARRGTPPPAPDATALPKEPAREESLPDVDRINSTLAPTPGPVGDRETAPSAPPARSEMDGTAPRRSEFWTGFFVVIVLTALLVGLYLAAPQIAEAIPSLEPAMASYVEVVNDLRDTVDAALGGLVATQDG